MRQQFLVFLLRWVMNSLGIWISVQLLGSANNAEVMTFVLAGLVFSLVNSVLRPVIVILSLPVILLTLGLFTLVVNGLMVTIAISFIPNLSMTFGSAIIAGIIMSLVNYIVSGALDLKAAAGK